ncbi:MAG: hypothetical protein IJ678_00885 [Kiritimatiellae bacterium]|nr:hypothetical protein [Kiritimatiellia bacterium]
MAVFGAFDVRSAASKARCAGRLKGYSMGGPTMSRTAVAIDTNGPSTKFMTGIWLDGGLSKDSGGTLTHSNGLFRFSDQCGGGDMDCWRKLKLQWIRKE